MRLRDNDIAEMLIHPGQAPAVPYGAYSRQGLWTTHLPGDVSDPASIMVELHERAHGYLNSRTAYGSVLLASGLLATNAPASGRAQRNVLALVDASRETHELYATAWGVWLTPGDPDELLAPYDGYEWHLRRARALVPGWREGSWASLFAVAALVEVCMQSPVIEHVLGCGLDRFEAASLPANEIPDRRLTALWKTFTSERGQLLEHDAELRFGENPLFSDLVSTTALENATHGPRTRRALGGPPVLAVRLVRQPSPPPRNPRPQVRRPSPTNGSTLRPAWPRGEIITHSRGLASAHHLGTQFRSLQVIRRRSSTNT